MPQPFWEVELAKQHGKLINPALDYAPESRTAPVFAKRPLTPTAFDWQPPPTVRPAQTYTPANQNAPLVFRHPIVAPQSAHTAPLAWKPTGTMRPPAARTTSGADGGAASDGSLFDLGARPKTVKNPPGWLAGTLIVIAGYVGSQLRHHEAPPVQAGAINRVAPCARQADRKRPDTLCARATPRGGTRQRPIGS